MKYRKKPVVIEAFKYDGDLMGSDGKYYVPDWAVKAYEDGVMFYDDVGNMPGELFIKTLEGTHHVSVGDYIIQGVNGELYPCKPDIFEKTYEVVDKAAVNNLHLTVEVDTTQIDVAIEKAKELVNSIRILSLVD